MGASIISSHAGLAPTVGGWTSAASELTGGMAVESNLVNGGGSYNPLGSPDRDDQDASYGSQRKQGSVYGGGDGRGVSGLNVDDVWNSPAELPPANNNTMPAPQMRESMCRHSFSCFACKNVFYTHYSDID